MEEGAYMVRQRANKGQGLVEFALIIPILLLLLTGIFEMGRVIWAYVTVQTAAREAARYAVTGRPYIDADQGNLNAKQTDGTCYSPEGDELPPGTAKRGPDTPWLCVAESRAVAIEEIAKRRLATLAGGTSDTTINPNTGVSNHECPETPDNASFFGSPFTPNTWKCQVDNDAENSGHAGVYGVVIVGQKSVPDPTNPVTSTILSEISYAGEEGLNVAVYTFYNVEMITPWFSALTRGIPITVRGQAQMQNEGIHPILGRNAPPLIPNNPPLPGGVPPCPEGCGDNGELIYTTNYSPTLYSSIDVFIEFHDPLLNPYKVFLQTAPNSVLSFDDIERYEICVPNVNTQGEGSYFQTCDISHVPPGRYCLYSQFASDIPEQISCGINSIAHDSKFITIEADENTLPTIIVTDNGRTSLTDNNTASDWAACSAVDVELRTHAEGDYDITLTEPSGSVRTIATNVTVGDTNSATIAWPRVPLPTYKPGDASPCSLSSDGCILTSIPVTGTGQVATHTIYIREPEINIIGGSSSGGTPTYKPGETVRVELSNHTPNQQYTLAVQRFITTTNQWELVETYQVNNGQGVNSNGASFEDFEIQAGLVSWPGGTYRIATYEADLEVDDALINDNDRCTFGEEVEFKVENDTFSPYIVIKGGVYDQPVGSYINIDLFNHAPGTYNLYMDPITDGTKSTYRVPSNGSSNFEVKVGDDGRATIGYEIPLDAATNRDVAYMIYSVIDGNTFDPNNGYYAKMDKNLVVISEPLIYALEGNVCLEPSHPDFNDLRVDDPTKKPNQTNPAGQRAVFAEEEFVICLRNHSGLNSYRLNYAERDMLTLQTVETNQDGEAQRSYSMIQFPAYTNFDLTNPDTWNIAYELASIDADTTRKIATSTITVRAIDLLAVEAKIDGNNCKLIENESGGNSKAINQNCMVEFTVSNTSDIELPPEYVFDLDLYHYYAGQLPLKKLTPAYRGSANFNFPGDEKVWSSTIPQLSDGLQALETFTFRKPFSMTAYGEHEFYIYADTTDFLREPNEANNVISTTATLSCEANPKPFTAGFNVNQPAPTSITYNFNDPNQASDWIGADFPSTTSASNIFPATFFIDEAEGDGDTEFIAVHNGGQGLAPGNDQKEGYYYKELLPNVSQIEVTIDPTLSRSLNPNSLTKVDYGRDGLAGIELREGLSPNDEVLFFGVRAMNDIGSIWRPTISWRFNNGGNADTANGAVNRIDISDFPVTLRIVRDVENNTYTFSFKGNGDANFSNHPVPIFTDNVVSLSENIYVGMSASYVKNSPDLQKEAYTIFDNFSVSYQESPTPPNDWTAMAFGNVSANEENYNLNIYNNNRITLNNTGNNFDTFNDAGGNGYLFARYNPITASTEIGFELETTINEIDPVESLGSTTKASSGLEIRNDGSNENSAKLQLMLVALTGAFEGSYLPVAYYRSNTGATTIWGQNDIGNIIGTANNVTLKITRDPERGPFHFYMNGTELFSSDGKEAEDIEGQVEVGLFNYSGSSQGLQKAVFSSFKGTYQDCQAGLGHRGAGNRVAEINTPPHEPPPGLRICTPGVSDTGFEQNLDVQWIRGGGSFLQAGSTLDGSRFMMAGPTYEGNNPFFFQEFDLDNWILDTTALQLVYSVNIDDRSDDNANDQADIFRAVIVKDAPDRNDSRILYDQATNRLDNYTQFTDIVALVNGKDDISYTGGNYDSSKWDSKSVTLPLLPGESLEVDNGNLYLLIFNSSNGPFCSSENICKSTIFYFENMQLNTCTTNEYPTEQEVIDQYGRYTHINGEATLYYNLGVGEVSQESIEGVRVWAYAEDGSSSLYETRTIQGGEFNFYGLPAAPSSAGGTFYRVYAEKVVRQEDGTLIELGDDRRVRITSDAPNDELSGVTLSLIDVE